MTNYRTKLIKRVGIKAHRSVQYKHELLKAYWTYRLNDAEFDNALNVEFASVATAE